MSLPGFLCAGGEQEDSSLLDLRLVSPQCKISQGAVLKELVTTAWRDSGTKLVSLFPVLTGQAGLEI